jgi:hypothetical protein
MKIQDNRIKHNSFKQYLSKFSGKRYFIVAISTIVLIVSILISILYGAFLHKTGRSSIIRDIVYSVSEMDYTFIKKYFTSHISNIDGFYIDVKFKNWEKIRYYREMALLRGSITEEMKLGVPGRILYNNQYFRVELSLTGLMIDHISHPNKWSLAVKVKDDKTIKGMKKFALLVPHSRGYLTDWIATELLMSRDIIGLRFDFANVSINGKDYGLYYLEERYEKRLIENNGFREGIIFKINDDGLNIYGMKKISEVKSLSNQLNTLRRLVNSFLTDKIEANKLFDLKKFASLCVVSDIMGQKHAILRDNVRFYFNPITNLIEPIGREWGYLKKGVLSKLRKSNDNITSLTIQSPDQRVMHDTKLKKDKVLKKLIDSFQFEEQYIHEAKILSNEAYLDSIININQDQIDLLLNKIHKHNPFYIFPLGVIHDNQEYIRNIIHTSLPDINVFYNQADENVITLDVENLLDLPIEIQYCTYNSQKIIFPSKRILLKSKHKASVNIQKINMNHDGKIDTQVFSSDSLELYYNVLGMDEIKKTIVYPTEMSSNKYSALNPATRDDNINEFSFLDIDLVNGIIEFPSESCVIAKDLIIPEGYVVKANPGCKIDMVNSSRVISYSPLLFLGKNEDMITITSSDSTGQGIIVLNCQRASELKHVSFTYLSNIDESDWSLNGVITFYRSDVNVIDCNFSENKSGDDYLNIVKSNFNIIGSNFTNTYADAFDSDYSSGTIQNVHYLNIGNDAIDISGTELYIDSIIINDAGDKAISAGEGSKVIGRDIAINRGEIALTSKDNSIIDIDRLSIKSSKVAYCSFQKKPEYGPGIISVKNVQIEDVDTKYLIEVGSSLNIDGNEINDKSRNVIELLYGNEYGKSSE